MPHAGRRPGCNAAGMNIVILTGAGISAESGVKTFRDDDGLWEGHDIQEVATPEAFERNPVLVQRFYDERRSQVLSVEPNAAHFALARLERELAGNLLVVTQNVDDLHERAGSSNVEHMHGELLSALCQKCRNRFEWHEPLSGEPACPGCGAARLRPDIVWFGEVPYHMDRIVREIRACDVFAAIGTSGVVYPAAGFVSLAAETGSHTVELNLQSSSVASVFDEVREGPATAVVTQWVNELIGGA